MERRILEVRALGRSCDLGQLYDARTSSLLHGFSLFKKSDITAREVDVANTTLKFKEVNSLSDRTSSLDISSEASLSVMSGLVSVGGVGAYLNSKHDTTESVTVAVVAQHRTTSKSLDFNDLISKRDMDDAQLARTGATHVVTSIVYGGDLVGMLTQKSTNKEGNTEMKGKFSTDILKGMEKWFSASTKGELSMEEKEKMNSFHLELELSADFSLKDEDATPTDPMSLISIVKKSAKLVGKGVPYLLSLTPLTMLPGDAPSFRKFNKADLVEIMDIYDSMLKLENSRASLSSAIEPCIELFPTFTGRVRHRFVDVRKLVQDARDKLSEYLRCYRSGQDGITPSEFVTGVKRGVVDAQAAYEMDKEEWSTYQGMLAIAERFRFPFISVSAVWTKMACVDKGMLVAVIVPEKASRNAVMNLYDDLAVDIRQWRASTDKGTDSTNFKGSQTEFISIYADPLRDDMLMSLDDEIGTLRNALASARESKSGVFLTYGRAQGHIGGPNWNVSGKEGWGIITDKCESWRYIGDVHLSKPHGRGVMTYLDQTNQTKYIGTFVNGQRDGSGEVVNWDGTIRGGVFINNVLEPQGILIDVTVVDKDGIAVQQGRVALARSDAVCLHVDRIGTTMGWGRSQRFCLYHDDGTKVEAIVDVIGNRVDPEEPETMRTSTWNLGVTSKVTAYIRYCSIHDV